MNSPSHELVEILSGYQFNFRDERELQDGIEEALRLHGIQFEREVHLSPRDRIDFLVAEGVGIEVKIAGSAMDLLRQLARYAEHDQIRDLVVVASRSYLACVGQAEFGDKTVSVVLTSRRAF